MFGLPGPAKLALAAAEPALRAEDELRAGCPDDRVYDLTLLATGSEEAAAAALEARVAARLRQGERPAAYG